MLTPVLWILHISGAEQRLSSIGVEVKSELLWSFNSAEKPEPESRSSAASNVVPLWL